MNTQEDINAVDTLPQYLVDHKIKKVMTRTKRFAINLNRLSGELPDWLLYHPALDLWIPYSLFFPQEGRGVDGTQAIFSNEPVNLNYYYDIYNSKIENYKTGPFWGCADAVVYATIKNAVEAE